MVWALGSVVSSSIGDLGTVLRRKVAGRSAAPIQISAPMAPDAVSTSYIVQCLCLSLVFVLHFLMLMLNFTAVLMTSAYSQYLKESSEL